MIPVWRRNYQRYRSYFSHIVSQYKERADVMGYLEILLSLATVSVFAMFALRPTMVTVAGLIREIDGNTETIKIMDEKIQNVTKAQTLVDRERSKIQLLLSAIPSGVQPETIMRQLEGLSEKHNVSVTNAVLGKAVLLGATAPIQEDPTKIPSGMPMGINNDVMYIDLTITLSAPLASYSSLSGFLTDLEKMRIPIVVKQMTTSSVRERNGKNLILVVKAYFPYTKGSTGL